MTFFRKFSREMLAQRIKGCYNKIMIFANITNFFYRLKRRIRYTYRSKIFIPKCVPKISKKIYAEILQKKHSNTILFILPELMGDVLYSMAFLEEFRKNTPPQFNIFVVAYEKHGTLIKTFQGYDKLLLFPMHGKAYRKIESLILNDKIVKDALKENIYIMINACADRNAQNPDFIYQLRNHVLKVGPNAPIHYHGLTPKEVRCIPDFSKIYDRIILINTRSNSESLSKEGIRWFEDISVYLTRLGYIVYSNVIEKQLPIKGTKALKCGLQELLSIVAKIPLVISLRSGVLDFLVKTNVNMFIVYVQSIHMDFCKIASWECNGQLEEVHIDTVLNDKENRLFKSFASKVLK